MHPHERLLLADVWYKGVCPASVRVLVLGQHVQHRGQLSANKVLIPVQLTRKLKQVTVEDAAEADRIFSVLMGNHIAPRKQFIAEHAETLDWDMLDL